jgi:hypothetical protein
MRQNLRPGFSLLLTLGLTLAAPAFAATGTYTFHGTAQDQVNKNQEFTDSTSRGTATFDQTPTTGTAPVTQTGSFAANADFVGNPLAIFWRGAFSGTVNGTLQLDWYWGSVDPEAITQGGTVEVSIFADPVYSSGRVQPQRLIGRGLVRLTGLGAAPVLETSLVPASGTVSSELLIQVVPRGAGLVVYYDATSTPSSFQFTDVQPPPPPPAAPQGSGLAPRYQNFTPAPAQVAAGMGVGSGEPSIGANWKSGNVMYEGAILQSLRVAFNDACPTTPTSTWVDKSAPTSVESLDPILFTDSATGRTFVSQLTGQDSLASYTDNDGDTWIPSQGGGIPSGIDHETVGGGPYHAPLTTGAGYSHAVYYCSQDVGTAFCARSDDGGLTYGAGVPIYTVSECGGLHGHVKVGPDGTVFVPNKGCQTGQGVVVSEDNGLTWNVRVVPGSRSGSSDPSVSVDKGGRVYLGYADNDNHPVVAVSDNHGQSWSNIFDVGTTFGLNNVAFPAVIGGDPGRAAYAFLGTSTGPGSLQAPTFTGVWHLYIATTFDGGAHWLTSDATPNDPVQRGCIWLGGGSNICRNLLDFMDATVDAQGRVLVGYADGCTGPCAQASTTSVGNGYTALATIARQTGGRRLFSAFDPAEPTAPGAPFLTVTRNGALARLTWSESENGGSPITNYQVLRGTSSGGETLLANVGTATGYTDAAIDPGKTYFYRVTAKNSIGQSCGGNEVAAAPAGSSCALPGVTVVTDAAGDQKGAPLNTALDIQSVSIAEPFFPDGSEKLFFTMRVADLSAVPANGQWRMIWNSPNAPDGGNFYVGMNSDQNSNVSFEYGTVSVTGAVVTSVGQFNTIGPADPESTFTSSGTITIAISNSLVGSPAAGDLIGGLVGRTYILTADATTSGRAAIDATDAPAAAYMLVGNAYCAPPPVTCLEDTDSHIAYSNGWHLVNDSDASAGHFRLKVGSGTATLAFNVPAGQFGAVTYNFARSPKGGSADVYLDGVLQGTVSYQGSQGTTQAPQFGFNTSYRGIPAGSHTLQIQAKTGAAYVDSFCLESSSSNSQPSSAPGQTTAGSSSLGPGQQVLQSLTLPAGAIALSVVAEPSAAVPIQLALIDPSGSVLQTADASSGFAVIEVPVSQAGVYLVKLVNVGLGPVNVWTATTPLISQ